MKLMSERISRGPYRGVGESRPNERCVWDYNVNQIRYKVVELRPDKLIQNIYQVPSTTHERRYFENFCPPKLTVNLLYTWDFINNAYNYAVAKGKRGLISCSLK